MGTFHNQISKPWFRRSGMPRTPPPQVPPTWGPLFSPVASMLCWTWEERLIICPVFFLWGWERRLQAPHLPDRKVKVLHLAFHPSTMFNLSPCTVRAHIRGWFPHWAAPPGIAAPHSLYSLSLWWNFTVLFSVLWLPKMHNICRNAFWDY